MLKKLFCILNVILFIFSMIITAEDIIQYQAIITQAKIFLSNRQLNFESPAVLINDRTYVPLREVSDALNVDVEWIENENNIVLRKNDESNDILLMFSAYPLHRLEIEVHLVKIYKSGKYEVTRGIRSDFSAIITDDDYVTPIETQTVYLFNREIAQINNLLDKIFEDEPVKISPSIVSTIDGDWSASLFFGNKVYGIYEHIWGTHSADIEMLMDLIVSFTPMDFIITIGEGVVVTQYESSLQIDNTMKGATHD